MDRQDLHYTMGLGHAVLFILHGIGAVYNLKRQNKIQALIHASVAIYDAWAINQHRMKLKDE